MVSDLTIKHVFKTDLAETCSKGHCKQSVPVMDMKARYLNLRKVKFQQAIKYWVFFFSKKDTVKIQCSNNIGACLNCIHQLEIMLYAK